jgi:hypothetical protein
LNLISQKSPTKDQLTDKANTEGGVLSLRPTQTQIQEDLLLTAQEVITTTLVAEVITKVALTITIAMVVDTTTAAAMVTVVLIITIPTPQVEVTKSKKVLLLVTIILKMLYQLHLIANSNLQAHPRSTIATSKENEDEANDNFIDALNLT